MQDLFAAATAPGGDPAILPKALAVLAHPDDETIALGARLGRFSMAWLVHVMDGAPLNGEDSRSQGSRTLADYREVRRQELRTALHGGAGWKPRSVSGNFRSAGRAVPACSGGAPAKPDGQAAAGRRVHAPYEGGHPDHDACAFAVHQAVRLFREHTRDAASPIIIKAPFYHAGPQGTETGAFLAMPEPCRAIKYTLTALEREQKAA